MGEKKNLEMTSLIITILEIIVHFMFTRISENMLNFGRSPKSTFSSWSIACCVVVSYRRIGATSPALVVVNGY